MTAAPMNVAGSSPDQVLSATTTSAAISQGEGGIAAGNPVVIGLDLSLTATGVAAMSPRGFATRRLTVEGTGIIRLRRLLAEVERDAENASLVVVEGPSYGSVGAGTHERAGLWWLVRDMLWQHSIPCAVVPPSNLKKYAVGVGGGAKASKDAVLVACARHWPTFEGRNDEADALWLAAMGLDYLTGRSGMPALNRLALKSCSWPTMAAAS